MQEKIWTWEEALANELFYSEDTIDFSRLYPPKISCVYIDEKRAFALGVVSNQMKGEIWLSRNSICYTLEIKSWYNDNEDFLNKFGEYVANYVLSVEESGILVTYEKFLTYDERDGRRRTYLRFFMSFNKEIIVRFREDDQKVYLEYPTRNLYTLP